MKIIMQIIFTRQLYTDCPIVSFKSIKGLLANTILTFCFLQKNTIERISNVKAMNQESAISVLKPISSTFCLKLAKFLSVSLSWDAIDTVINVKTTLPKYNPFLKSFLSLS